MFLLNQLYYFCFASKFLLSWPYCYCKLNSQPIFSNLNCINNLLCKMIHYQYNYAVILWLSFSGTLTAMHGTKLNKWQLVHLSPIILLLKTCHPLQSPVPACCNQQPLQLPYKLLTPKLPLMYLTLKECTPICLRATPPNIGHTSHDVNLSS